MSRHRIVIAAVLALAFVGAAAATAQDIPLRNWTVPSASSGKGRSTLAEGYASIFIPITPCRVADTRGNGFIGAYGPPALIGGGAARSFSITGSTCTGIPGGATAFSLNFTVVAPGGTPPGGYLTAFPTGGAQPVVSTLNFGSGSILANAAVVPAGGGAISVFVNFTTDLIIDINGYYLGGGNFGTLNPQQFMGYAGSYDGGGIMFAHNNSTSTNDSTTSVRGQISGTQNNASGVWGESTAGTGAHYGVKGTNNSVTSGSAAVFGSSGTAAWTSPYSVNAGVRGASDGASFSFGVLGEGTSRGVHGARVSSAGAVQSAGVLGYSGTSGVHSFGDITATGTKSFVEPHPTDPGRQIVYIAMEGPEAGTYFRGRGRFEGKLAVIVVPESFRLVTEEEGLTVQITPIGRATPVGVVSMDLNQIVVEAGRDVEFSYLVQGVRHHRAKFEPIQPNTHFVPAGADARMEPWPEQIQKQLIDLGIYGPDGKVNMQTAERMGWAQKWRDDAAREAARAAAREEEALRDPQTAQALRH